MAGFAKCLFFTVLAVAFCVQAIQAPAQTSPAASSSPAAAAPASSDKPHGAMPAELTKSLDSKKLKEGDPVTGRITADLNMRDGGAIPRGSKLIGHVTEAKARSKGDAQSELGIVFDKISLPDGKDLTIKGSLQAVAPNPNSSSQQYSSAGPAMMPGHETGGSAATTPPPLPSMPNQGSSGPILNGQSKGVLGIRNLQMGENSVLTSSGKEVKLDSGSQMMVYVEIQ